MTDQQNIGTQNLTEVEESIEQEGANSDSSSWLFELEETDKNDAEAEPFSKDSSDPREIDPMLVLAKCCAFGQGTERDAERAEALISEAANQGNEEAQSLLKVIDLFQGKQVIGLSSL